MFIKLTINYGEISLLSATCRTLLWGLSVDFDVTKSAVSVLYSTFTGEIRGKAAVSKQLPLFLYKVVYKN
jgi:hypothetical protein